jgi:hypothetical protein
VNRNFNNLGAFLQQSLSSWGHLFEDEDGSRADLETAESDAVAAGIPQGSGLTEDAVEMASGAQGANTKESVAQVTRTVAEDRKKILFGDVKDGTRQSAKHGPSLSSLTKFLKRG